MTPQGKLASTIGFALFFSVVQAVPRSWMVMPSGKRIQSVPKTSSTPLSAAAAAVIDGPVLAVLSVQLLGSPSVASTMIGGEPAGGGLAAKSATTASIDGAVGVRPPGVKPSMVAWIAAALFCARPTEV